LNVFPGVDLDGLAINTIVNAMARKHIDEAQWVLAAVDPDGPYRVVNKSSCPV